MDSLMILYHYIRHVIIGRIFLYLYDIFLLPVKRAEPIPFSKRFPLLCEEIKLQYKEYIFCVWDWCQLNSESLVPTTFFYTACLVGITIAYAFHVTSKNEEKLLSSKYLLDHDKYLHFDIIDSLLRSYHTCNQGIEDTGVFQLRITRQTCEVLLTSQRIASTSLKIKKRLKLFRHICVDSHGFIATK